MCFVEATLPGEALSYVLGGRQRFAKHARAVATPTPRIRPTSRHERPSARSAATRKASTCRRGRPSLAPRARAAAIPDRTQSRNGFVCGGRSGPRKWFGPCLEAATITGFSWHCLRHTFASRLVMSGADVRTVAELLRDRTLAMVMRYAHLAHDYRMEAVQRMQSKFKAGRRKRVGSGTQSGTADREGGPHVH
jgi:hypothetical protein